jgi:hypothetical protein
MLIKLTTGIIWKSKGGLGSWRKALKDFLFLLPFPFFFQTRVWTQGLYLDPLYQPFYCDGFFEIGSPELFARAGLEPRSSWSLPPE